ncbi:hypothetical protein PF005_g19665 [Phytophthora fragariae]|uniref:Uncharacterized protein n=1 Tax=Phytophthora fragariae TaxID=53985 RepID=A0A6A3E3M2_9STRA|nr:hypothetical protein PF003_g3176 [Phytophthora fragariae]KAE8928469.1 hypothetical protein PF009_g21394 [Phytophthora fragariae]KAE8996195.1 hypothetical protein PF011_g16010 [Phytophthora fragariae]KAE9087334.1 hypothetical protein PF007_g20417 [Phytophthora fragariae]KAE9089792.1 hypothetical protein PF010_g18844 [Phytophthora fragariae]
MAALLTVPRCAYAVVCLFVTAAIHVRGPGFSCRTTRPSRSLRCCLCCSLLMLPPSSHGHDQESEEEE